MHWLVHRYLGVGLAVALLVVALLAMAGVCGRAALSEVRGDRAPPVPGTSEKLNDWVKLGCTSRRSVDPKSNVIELAAYKRVAASYESQWRSSLRTLNAVGLTAQPAAATLTAAGGEPGILGQGGVAPASVQPTRPEGVRRYQGRFRDDDARSGTDGRCANGVLGRRNGRGAGRVLHQCGYARADSGVELTRTVSSRSRKKRRFELTF